jgi:flagellar protein FliO/FliZ
LPDSEDLRPNDMNTPWTSLIWFVAVLAMIPLALWLLKRSPLGAGLTGFGAQRSAVSGLPKPVAVLPLSAQHKLVTVEVGQGEERVWLVLGVSPQGLRTLHTMSPGADALVPKGPGTGKDPATSAPAATFHQLLSRMKKGPKP